jgi:plasmid maintenance system antidote protein VapI
MALREIPLDELADSLALTSVQFEELIAGHLRITETLAVALANQLGSSPRLWLARDKTYLRDLGRIGEARNRDVSSWSKTMPVASMKRYGWLSKQARGDDLSDELLRFFGCSNLKDWGIRYSNGVGAVAFKTSLAFEADAMSTLVWLRVGEQRSSELPLPRFDRTAFMNQLPAFKKVSVFKHPTIYFAKLQAACQAVGVALTSGRARKDVGRAVHLG